LQLCNLDDEIADLQSLLEDPEMRESVQEELKLLAEKRKKLERKLATFDPDDEKNAIIEIQAGTGGDEAALFAGDVCKMYIAFCKQKGFSIEEIDFSPGNLGGIKYASFLVEGENVYGTFKYESGVHRVQRVPKTETKGRVHTSTIAVVVLPEHEIEQVNINRSDVKIENFSAGGPGGQSVNKNHCAVRLTHVPTGVNVTSRTKSMQANLKYCWKVLATRIRDMQLEQLEKDSATAKKNLRGRAKRSEKIRTYNFPNDRLTDHRIEDGKYCLSTILSGQLEDLIQDLQEAL